MISVLHDDASSKIVQEDVLLGSKRRLEEAQKQENKVLAVDETCDLKCQVCVDQVAKYRCPKCALMTCSLLCCQEHKRLYVCDGKRDRTKFIAVKDFKDSDMYNDYFLLEEVSKSTDRAKRQMIKDIGGTIKSRPSRRAKKNSTTSTSCSSNSPNPEITCTMQSWLSAFPKSCQILVEQAKRVGVKLHLLSNGMSKRKLNTSYYDYRKRELSWRIELDFPFALGDSNMTLCKERMHDELTIFSILERNLKKCLENADRLNKLQAYDLENEFRDVVLLLRKEFTPSRTPMYFELDPHQSLRNNLAGKTIVEYPCFLLIPKSQIPKYTIVPSPIQEISATLPLDNAQCSSLSESNSSTTQEQ